MTADTTIFVCRGTGCVSANADLIMEGLVEELKKAGLDSIEVKQTGCHGFCEKGPIVVIEEGENTTLYTLVKPEDAERIVQLHLVNHTPIEELLYTDPETGEKAVGPDDIKFYSHQHRVILENCGHIDPESIADYKAVQGFVGLESALAKTPEEVIGIVLESGLRGRGGAGFPVGMKWKLCRQNESDKRYVVCNADEGDPGAFMDRSILEADPFKVIEGMTIAAYAIGADEGYVYARAEYPLAVSRLMTAIGKAQEEGYLGNDILGSGFSFDLHVKEGAGAFVCGEETALLESLEGKRGMPRPRPPYPAQKGLWGKPTIINNVKSLASVSVILREGEDFFKAIGSESSKGTAVFALTGKISNSGLVEVPMGATLREIVEVIGGGVPDGKALKAVQTGGPSGGCIPASMLDLTVDYESLQKAGSIMGSGGMVVMDEETCMVDVAKYFISFTQYESCGKCPPCRIGTKKMKDILEKITAGLGEPEDLELLEQIATTVKEGSLCQLGGTAPNPVLSTLRYFREEYEAHIIEGRCPAAVCKPLITFTIDADACIGCTLCAKNCPAGCIEGAPKETHVIDQSECVKCGMCHSVCPKNAVIKASHGRGGGD